MNEWLRIVQHRAVSQMSQPTNNHWLDRLQEQCAKSMADFHLENSLLHRTPQQLQQQLTHCQGLPCHLPDAIQEAYRETVYFLREAEKSGLWPASSVVG